MQRSLLRVLPRLAAAVGVALVVSACAPVKPYERELLAMPGMQLDAEKAAGSEQHMLESREATVGGYGAAGGGCGCN